MALLRNRSLGTNIFSANRLFRTVTLLQSSPNTICCDLTAGCGSNIRFSELVEMELDIWPGDWGLPSMETKCLQILCYTRFSGVPLKVIPKDSSWLASTSDLPVFRHGSKAKLTKFSAIVEYLQKQNYSANFNLSKKEQSDIVAYSTMLHSKLEPVIQYLWFVDERNYVELTRPWMAKRLRFPANYIVPGLLQRNAEGTLLSQFGDIERPVLENALFKEAQKCLTLLSERLGDNEFFFGKQPTAFDALVFSYIGPLVKVPFPSSNHLRNHLMASDNLMSFVNRILRKYFPTATNEQQNGNAKADIESNFPNKRREMIFSGLFATVAMFSYAYLKGLIRF